MDRINTTQKAWKSRYLVDSERYYSENNVVILDIIALDLSPLGSRLC